MGRQSSQGAFGVCEADGCALVRLVGTTARGHSATKRDPAQRAKAGFWLCCARATRAALPPSYCLGKRNALEDDGIALWKKLGRWAPRRLASFHFVKTLWFIIEFVGRGGVPRAFACSGSSSAGPIACG